MDIKYIILMIVVGLIFAVGSACSNNDHIYSPEIVDSGVEV